MSTKTQTINSTATTTTKEDINARWRKKDVQPRPFALLSNGDQLLPNGEIINWYKGGIINQMDKIGELYDEWIDHPKIGKIRIFDNDFLEGLTFTYWWTVPAIYVPWSLLELRVCYRYYTDNIFNEGIHIWNPLESILSPLLSSLVYYFLGIILWTLFEYFCHRYVFHWHPPNASWNSIHFFGHGMHHLTPADDLRLVFPPTVSMPLGLFFWWLYTKMLFATAISNAILGGFVLGYAWYESTHFLSHHCPFGNYLQARFRYHSAHHFNPAKKDSLYGVTSQMWDVVFNTF